MKHIIPFLCIAAAIALESCGTAAATLPPRSDAEIRQTERALLGVPTLQPMPTSPEGQSKPTPITTPTPDITNPDILEIPADDPRSMGSLDAPVTMIEYSDFECPFCIKFFNETRKSLEEQYVTTGIVRMIYRDFPLPNHPSAELASVASRCAADQGQFWAMHQRLFSTHQQEWGGVPNRDYPVMVEFANDLGLDRATFERCLADEKVLTAVRQEVAMAEALGVNSTPNFIINGQFLRGAMPLSTFQRLIDQLNAKNP